MDLALGLILMALVLGTPLGVAGWRRWEGAKVLGKLVAQTGGELVSYREMRCRRHGYQLQFFRDRSTDGSVVTMPLPPGYPLSIDIRRRGLVVLAKDVPRLELGDVQFDRAFTVEASPAAVVEQLLGVEVRSFLLDHRECVLMTQNGHLRLSSNALRGAAALEAIELVARMVGSIRDAFAKLAAEAEAIALAEGDSPYRPIAVDAGPDLAQAHEAEVAKLERLQRRAGWLQALRLVIFVAAGLGLLAAIKLLNQR